MQQAVDFQLKPVGWFHRYLVVGLQLVDLLLVLFSQHMDVASNVNYTCVHIDRYYEL